MKKYIYKILPILFVIFFSCDEDLTTEGVSRVTFYNDIELLGEETQVVDQGTAFVDQGAIATEGDADVTENIEVSGTVDHTTVGYYPVTYNIKNVDGFAKSIVRNVFVLPVDRSTSDIYVGTYTGDVSNGTHADASVISYLGDGLYFADDFIGGRYTIGRGLPPNYKISAYFYVNGDGLSYEALLTDSPWGPWGVLNPTLTGTTFDHQVQNGTFVTPVVLIKQ
jgi:hypothetical protein